MSPEHERQLMRVARESYAGVATSTRFVPLDNAPERWAASTAALLEALSATRSATAFLSANKLMIRGVGASNWVRQLERLHAAIPESIRIDTDVVVPDPQIQVVELCARAVSSHQTSPIYFEESAATFRSSAFAVLEKIMSLAATCRDFTISITGHTDSSGYEPSNRQLSVTRAQIVADYFAAHGIARNRLRVSGVGSSLPVADNETRFGRGLNRRITIELKHAD